MIANKEIFLTEYLDIIKVIESGHDIDHAELFKTLEEVDIYKKTSDKDATDVIAEHIVKAILNPYWVPFYKTGRDSLIQSISDILLQYFQSNKMLFKKEDTKDIKTEQVTLYTKDRSMEDLKDLFRTTKNASDVVKKVSSIVKKTTYGFKDDLIKRVGSEDKKDINSFKDRKPQHRLERDVRLDRKDIGNRESKKQVYYKQGQNHRLEVIRKRVVGNVNTNYKNSNIHQLFKTADEYLKYEENELQKRYKREEREKERKTKIQKPQKVLKI